MALRLLTALALGVWFGVSGVAPAWPAQILVSPATETVAQVTITGELHFEDALTFLRKTKSLKKAVVLLRSPGGNAVAGVLIGRAIRKKGYLTVVPPGASCASACALAWLGGTRRFMGRKAQIGFHAAYTLRGGRARRSRSANVVLAEYVAGLGLSQQAVGYVVGASPERMYWLTLASAQAAGIETGLYSKEGIAVAVIQARPASLAVQAQPAPLTIHTGLVPLAIKAATDYPGNDIGLVKESNILACWVACRENAACKAFTFITYREECWLKNATGSAQASNGLISGIK